MRSYDCAKKLDRNLDYNMCLNAFRSESGIGKGISREAYIVVHILAQYIAL